MADFCAQCSIDTFGRDGGDLKGLTPVLRWVFGEAAGALCEGCGAIQVDPHGYCVSPDCLEKGQPGHGRPWAIHVAPTEEDVSAFISSLGEQGTPWSAGCAALLANLWLRQKRAKEAARPHGVYLSRSKAQVLAQRIVKIQKILENDITFTEPVEEIVR